MSEPTREEVLWALRERVAHLEWHRGRDRIAARIHELECMRAAIRLIEAARTGPWEEGYRGFGSKEAYEAHYSDVENYRDELPAMERYAKEADAERRAVESATAAPAVPEREEIISALRERVAHLEIHRGRGPINARLRELECMRAALRELDAHAGPWEGTP